MSHTKNEKKNQRGLYVRKLPILSIIKTSVSVISVLGISPRRKITAERERRGGGGGGEFLRHPMTTEMKNKRERERR